MKAIFLTVFFLILYAFILLPNSADAARGGDRCYVCPRIEGKKASLQFRAELSQWQCMYVNNGVDCDPQVCGDPKQEATPDPNPGGICPSGQSCSEDVYTGCVAGSPGPSCTVSSNNCRQSSGTPNEGGCQLSNACTNYYCVEYKGTNPYEVTLGYANSTGRRGICEKLDTRPPLASSSGPGSSLIKDSVTTIVGTGTDSGKINPAPIECKTTTAQCLKDEFNVILQGVYTDDERNDIFNILAIAGSSSKYKTLLKSSGPTIFDFVDDASKGGGCPARVQPNGNGTSTMTLWNYSLSDCDRTKRKSRVIHETGHVLRNGHIRLFQLFEARAYNKDSGCYYRYNPSDPPFFIKTYDTSFAASIGFAPSGSNETMAEFISLSIVPEDQYPEKCPTGYRWVRENIFGI